MTSSLGFKLLPVALEAHWLLLVERNNDQMLRISKTLSNDYPFAPLNLIVYYANLATSHTTGPESFTPPVSTCGAQPHLPTVEYKQILQIVRNRMDLINTARREFGVIMACLHVRRAMNTEKRNESVQEHTPREEVLVYREKNCADGPYTLLYRDGSLCVVLVDKGREHLFPSTMLKPYDRPLMEIKDLLNPTDDEVSETLKVFFVETVYDENDSRFTECWKKGFDEHILQKGGVKPVSISALPSNANIICNCYQLVSKDPGTESERFKAR